MTFSKYEQMIFDNERQKTLDQLERQKNREIKTMVVLTEIKADLDNRAKEAGYDPNTYRNLLEIGIVPLSTKEIISCITPPRL